jgi:hypothetical protein
MTPETKTEARERMDDRCESKFEGSRCAKFAGHQGEHHDPVMSKRWMFERQIEEPASVASLSAALSALRAEHQRVQEQAAAMRATIEDKLVTRNPWGAWCHVCGVSAPKELAFIHGERCSLRQDAGRGWVSPEEHQRVVAERDWAREELRKTGDALGVTSVSEGRALQAAASLRSQLAEAQKNEASRVEDCNDLRRHLAEATKERDEARLNAADEFGRVKSLKAALAASEEKARTLRAVLEQQALGPAPRRELHCNICGEVGRPIQHKTYCALSSSPAPGAAPTEPKTEPPHPVCRGLRCECECPTCKERPK